LPAERAPLYNLYIDDTGSRHLDRLAATANQHPKWFALGGVLVRSEDEETCKIAYDALYSAWPQMRGPLHISDMQAKRQHFSWLEKLSPPERSRFWNEYEAFLIALPVLGTACVINRPGYLARGYGSRVGDAKWNLCRTAFNIVVERSAKLALSEGRRLRVLYEGSNRDADQQVRGYFALLQAQMGLGFDGARAAKYDPMDAAALARTLVELERKDKRSKLMQIADTFVYAISRGRYEPAFRLHRCLAEAGKLVTDHVGPERADILGVKYYCFDGL
jgi:hypothetical protein